MIKIINTRRTVRNYVLFNLGYLVTIIVVVATASMRLKLEDTSSKSMIIAVLVIMVLTGVAIGLFWLFYQLLYGILLRKLNKNYKELAKLDELN